MDFPLKRLIGLNLALQIVEYKLNKTHHPTTPKVQNQKIID
jgi:hypothetical protein